MVRVIEEVVKNKTVTEVVVDAQNATVVLAERVSQSDAVQGAKVRGQGRVEVIGGVNLGGPECQSCLEVVEET